MTGKDRPGEVIEPLPTDGALIPLPFRLGLVVPLFRDLGRLAMGADHPRGQRIVRTLSKHLASSMRFKTFRIRAHTILVSEKPSFEYWLQGRDYSPPLKHFGRTPRNAG